MEPDELSFWRTQAPVTEPGGAASDLDWVPADPDALTAISAQLVFHYRADGDWAANGIGSERAREINLCYASDMFTRLLELKPALAAQRAPAERILGCCRDFTNLYVSALRHHGIPARARVGFGAYFDAGWLIDHVVAEVWDSSAGRWRLIDPELRPEFEPADGGPLDRLDLDPGQFLTAPRVWLLARAGELDPQRVVVDPDLQIPDTRGWEQIRHNLLHDLASLNKTSLLLWDSWGIGNSPWPQPLDILELLDRVAADIADPACPLATIRDWGHQEGLAVPATVTRADPVSGAITEVDVSRALVP